MERAILLKKGDALAVTYPTGQVSHGSQQQRPNHHICGLKMQSREMWARKKSGISEHQAQLLQVARLWVLLATHSIAVVDAIFYRKPEFVWF